eukprot:1108927-Pleurochrysis_carterae.AAC.2
MCLLSLTKKHVRDRQRIVRNKQLAISMIDSSKVAVAISAEDAPSVDEASSYRTALMTLDFFHHHCDNPGSAARCPAKFLDVISFCREIFEMRKNIVDQHPRQRFPKIVPDGSVGAALPRIFIGCEGACGRPGSRSATYQQPSS